MQVYKVILLTSSLTINELKKAHPTIYVYIIRYVRHQYVSWAQNDVKWVELSFNRIWSSVASDNNGTKIQTNFFFQN